MEQKLEHKTVKAHMESTPMHVCNGGDHFESMGYIRCHRHRVDTPRSATCKQTILKRGFDSERDPTQNLTNEPEVSVIYIERDAKCSTCDDSPAFRIGFPIS